MGRPCSGFDSHGRDAHAPAARDRQMDRLVYDLYGLTDEEIAIVEEGTE